MMGHCQSLFLIVFPAGDSSQLSMDRLFTIVSTPVSLLLLIHVGIKLRQFGFVTVN